MTKDVTVAELEEHLAERLEEVRGGTTLRVIIGDTPIAFPIAWNKSKLDGFSVRINTPYFLPDQSLRKAFIETARRGVKVHIIVPGSHTDQRWVRIVSRRKYRELLHAGVRIYEYRAGMTHAKVLNVDDLWVVVGTTNFDNRSFEHNDEVNVAIRDEAVSARLKQDFREDLKHCEEVTLDTWRRRSLFEKIVEPFCWILERQQ